MTKEASRPLDAARPGNFPSCCRWLLPAAVCLIAVAGRAARTDGAGGQLVLKVIDRDSHRPLACRVHLVNAKERPVKPRGIDCFEGHFVFDGEASLRLPVGNYFFEMECGPEYRTRTGRFTIDNFADDTKTVDMVRCADMAAEGWFSGDLEVYRAPDEIELLMRADDVHVVPLITWWNHGPLRDRNELLAVREKAADGAEAPTADNKWLVRFDDDRLLNLRGGGYARPGGQLLVFNLPEPLLLKQAAAEFPPTANVLESVRRRGRKSGVWIDCSKPFWWDLPMLVANELVDSIQVAHSHIRRNDVKDDEAEGRPRDRRRFPDAWGNPMYSQDIYFRLLDCGLRLPPTAGSGSGRSSNPVGYNRLYVHVDGRLTYENWWENLRAGRVTVTNGPLLRPIVHGELPGHVFRADDGEAVELEIGLTLSTRERISYLEIIKNGRIEHSLRFEEYASSGRLPPVRFEKSGWFLVRAVTDVRETYRFAMTGPYYVEIGYGPRISREDAQFFLDWVYQRARQLPLDDAEQREAVLESHRRARDFWRDLVDRANAE